MNADLPGRGFKFNPHPKIEVYRPSVGSRSLRDDHIVAVASDEQLDVPLPLLSLNDPHTVADFMLDHLGLS